MKVLTKVQMMENSSSAIIGILATFVMVSAVAQERKPVDPSGPFSRRAGFLTQLESGYAEPLSENALRVGGNATIISPCRIITNYHVAFGKSKYNGGSKITMVKDRTNGHEVNLAFDLDASGKFKGSLKARVIGFGNYMKTDAGVLGDLAVLEVEMCLDQKGYAQLDLAMAESRSDVPLGVLMTISTAIDANEKFQILAQEGCKAETVTPIDGLFISNC